MEGARTIERNSKTIAGGHDMKLMPNGKNWSVKRKEGVKRQKRKFCYPKIIFGAVKIRKGQQSWRLVRKQS